MMKEAMTAYNKAVRLDPMSARVYNHWGDAYRRLGRYRQALLDYNQAIRLAPQLGGVLRWSGVCLYPPEQGQ
jgi:tetratricopeptide (TPR) repeat protein